MQSKCVSDGEDDCSVFPDAADKAGVAADGSADRDAAARAEGEHPRAQRADPAQRRHPLAAAPARTGVPRTLTDGVLWWRPPVVSVPQPPLTGSASWCEAKTQNWNFNAKTMWTECGV